MIRIENTDVFGWESAIRGMRNPMNSWDKMDSFYTCRHSGFPCQECIDYNGCKRKADYCVGTNDLALMKKLVNAGSDHSKFMRMITVTADITAPLYWWKEYDTYKVGTVANSCSTMHKIHAKEFTREDFSTEHLGCLQAGSGAYWDTEEYFEEWLTLLNVCREAFIKTNDKAWWWQMIQLLPTSYNQKRTVQLNYAVLRNMYHSRRNHKLDEWRAFCERVESLPYAKELICDE